MARILLVALVLLQGGAAFAAGIVTDVVPLERNGINLHLQRMFSEEAPGDRQLLLVHGLTYSSHEFDVDTGDYSLARFLASNGFTVWMLDIAGYGSSQEVEDVLFWHPAEMLAAVLAQPDPKWGETPCAYIELMEGSDAT